jgi:PIN domain nuclease of toxin-antitoxin system
VFVSAATIWEAMVKSGLGRLDIGDADLVDEIGANEFEDLAISASHARDAALLAPLHRDPFDRMLIAQARAESLCVVTRDGIFERYGVEILW